MGRYLKAAIFATVPLPVLGNVPVNLIAFLGFGILGLGHPGFWLLGLGLEAAYLFTLATNARFRRSVDSRVEMNDLASTEAKRRILIGRLNPEARKKLDVAEGKSRRILQTLRDHETEEYVLLSNVEALNKLIWVYIKLLFARTVLESAGPLPTSDKELVEQAETLKREIADERLSLTVRQSKQATLEILAKRIDNVARRTQAIHELESDLQRIEAQLDLGLENAAIRNREQAVDFDLDFVSHLMDSSLYGDSVADFADGDALYKIQQKPEPDRENAPREAARREPPRVRE